MALTYWTTGLPNRGGLLVADAPKRYGDGAWSPLLTLHLTPFAGGSS